ncbi:coq1 putative hexaprenyl diphosphate synthase [Boothiomyces macroporosus]|uniref:Coq1 putative hexaprenyl diphosphate synthase n=1 Tax=Boothiomyces macroporosus TaxID=261099 RepID=A0AAD5Y4C7_9FUNG|nr:coq1 putative hexaprenyl diphosphate synthase [Boothiomyces macroporosus]
MLQRLFKSQWQKSIYNAEKLVHSGSGSVINPKELLGKDLSLLTDNIRKLLGSGHPVLETVSNYYFSKQGKHVRPLLVLLVSLATTKQLKTQEIDKPLTNNSGIFFKESKTEFILPTQRRLAEITEMIHTASLLHDDVIDLSLTRRGANTANHEFGNKMAILAGDFLLARASVALARLRNLQVVELLATVISNLVEGEFMQLRNNSSNPLQKFNQQLPPVFVNEQLENSPDFQYYIEKTYMKTASLIAKSCQAATILGGCDEAITDAAYSYGRNLGLAFQLVDDMLDFVVTENEFGKPVNADLSLGLATAPVLYAANEFPELLPLIERKFSQDGDVAIAKELVLKSKGIEKTRQLAKAYCDAAIQDIQVLEPSRARTALIEITEAVLTRTK